MTTDTAAAEAASGAEAPETEEIEAKARDQGWTPKDEFKGKADKWVDAKEYVRRGDDPAYWRDQVKTLKQESRATRQELTRELADQRKSFAERLETMGKASARALTGQRERIYEEFEEAKRQAVEDGDTAKYDSVTKKETSVRKKHAEEDEEFSAKADDKPEKTAAKKPGDKVEGHDNAIAEWWGNNLEIWSDERKAQAVGMLYKRAEAKGLKTIEEKLKFIEDGLQRAGIKTYDASKEDDDEPKTRMPSVEGGSRGASGSRGKKGWSEIPAEERKIYERHVREKLYTDQAEAAKAYWGN